MINLKNITVAISFLALLFLMTALANPIGEFPLNDDWSYSYSVRSLIERNELEFTDWVSMPLITQVIWGTLFTITDGFSFTALRISTLFLAFWAVVATYVLLRSTSADAVTSAIGALSLLTNPIFFSLSHTFMTDVPFTAMFVTSTAFLFNGLRRDSLRLILAGLFFAFLALFIRQLGLALFIGFAIGYVSRNGFSPRVNLIAISPLVAATSLYLSYGFILDFLEKTPALYNIKTNAALDSFTSIHALKSIIFNAIKFILYAGLFLLPLLFLQSSFLSTINLRKIIWPTGGLLLAGALVLKDYSFPLGGNVLFRTGCGTPEFSVGPLTLRDTYILCTNFAAPLPTWMQTLFLVVSAVSGAFMFYALIRQAPSQYLNSKQNILSTNWPRIFLLSTIFAYIAPLLLGGFFDRYLIPILPLLIAAILESSKKFTIKISHILIPSFFLILTASFSLTATHDYLAWNRARWIGLNFLQNALKASPLQIDGGFEFNGLNNYSHEYVRQNQKSWWWVYDDLYVISFTNLDGYREIKSFDIDPWLPGSKDRILVLMRVEG